MILSRRAPGEQRVAASPWAATDHPARQGRPVIGFVIPWYGATITGGAEALCRDTAEQLQRRGYPVEVLTTCARQFHGDWGRNYHRPGVYQVNGVPVRRFSLRPRNGELFHSINMRLMRGMAVSAAEERQFMAEMINSADLYRFLAERRDDYIFVFLPYMFSTTYYGTRVCPERSWIIPCLHDEGHAHMALLRPMFADVRGLIFNSAPERALARQLFDLDDKRLHLVGVGVNTDIQADSAAWAMKNDILEDFILYVGRRDTSKNTPLLLEYFVRYKERKGGNLKLVLIGSGPIEDTFRQRADVLDLGFVSRGRQVLGDGRRHHALPAFNQRELFTGHHGIVGVPASGAGARGLPGHRRPLPAQQRRPLVCHLCGV